MNYLKLFFISFLFIGLIFFILKFSQAPVSDSDQVKIPEYSNKKISNGSLGCGNHASKDLGGSFVHDGMKREYIISIPKNYDRNKPTQLVYAFHGRTNTNYKVKNYYDLEQNSKQTTIFVYPESLKQKDGTNTWNNKSTNLLDYEMFDALNNKISSEYCINPDRIFIVGHSLGGAYVNSLGCKKGNVLRGFVSLGGGGVVNNFLLYS